MVSTALLSSKYDSWETPPWLLEAILELYGREEFDLDPCCTNLNVPAVYHIQRGVGLVTGNGTRFIADTCGLSACWGVSNLVLVNPPYGKELLRWSTKCATEGARNDVWLLCPARTDTAWFQTQVFDRASEIYFLTGRVTFYVDGQPYMALNKRGKWEESPSPYPIALVRYYPEGTPSFGGQLNIRHRHFDMRRMRDDPNR